ncbi:hypothetical protein [Edaphobacter bradus]|uniref:hypothetical protein n=1 Tax=Edaphobacter bradus TaxID=2259016 RepID=UPI0021E0B674|nr:hypothetical protein [Edaphobacter bradus]
MTNAKKPLGIAILSLLVTGMAAAQTPSSKATAAYTSAVGCTVSNASNIGTAPLSCHDIFSGAAVAVTPDNFVPVMDATVKVSNSTSLFVSPSMVTGLYTSTTTRTKTGSTSTATALGGVYERAVLLDGAGNVVATAYPVAACEAGILGCQPIGGAYGVTIDSRVQTLTQSLSDCVVTVGTTTGSCSFTSTIGLVLQTTSAHTYNFIFPNVGVGTYTVEIQMAVNSNAQVTGTGSAVGAAAFGLGSMTVDVVRLVHDFSF